MSATLSLLNNFSTTIQGNVITGKQGAVADSFSTAYALSITGYTHRVINTIATATVNTIYDASNDFPATFAYAHFWADHIVYLQIVGSATNGVFKIAPFVPFTISGYGSILAAATTTLITGGAEPAVTAVSKIAVGNYSGSAANFILSIFL